MNEYVLKAVEYIPLVCLVASAIVNFTPNETDDKYFKLVIKAINFLAINFDIKGLKQMKEEDYIKEKESN